MTRVWARRGTRPRAPRDRRYQWAYLFGAVCPARAATAALVLPEANTQAMSLHLAEIARQVATGSHAALVFDGAGYHGAISLVVPDNITLIPLPPYAPEHNPDEFLNNDLKQAMARRRTPRDKIALKSSLTSYMRSLQRCPAKVRAFFQAPTVRYAA